ncbi:lysozyme-like [Mercenaria mercenaria]|uniref:lysozyme-like n=1 Tax=Mercenaria mercenaria TaxID=6596 RepID=UPI00234E987B|nr:lysozyme-like [Mercenaria mercenaria]
MILVKTMLGAAVSVTNTVQKPRIAVRTTLPYAGVESGGCKPLDCRFDINGDACGYFQIHYAYYIDCHKPKPGWEKCSKDYNCASRCVRAYMARYKNLSYAGTNCESYARLHNGGPSGANKQITSPPIYDSTTPYWKKVKAQGCSINS